MLSNNSLKCCFTGHRPNKLPGGYDWYHPKNIQLFKIVRQEIIKLIEDKQVNDFIFGAAIGFDQAVFAVCEKLKKEKYPDLHLILAIPFKNQYIKWQEQDVEKYMHQKQFANKLYYIDEMIDTKYFCDLNGLGNYHPAKMQKRNEFMVDWAQGGYCIACYDGTKGGTENCIKYALKQSNLKLIIINPNTFGIQYLNH